MVRFGHLTSWRSWDLLHDYEMQVSPPADTKPMASDSQVRWRSPPCYRIVLL